MIKKYLEYINESKSEKDYNYSDFITNNNIDIDIETLIKLDNECDSIKIGDDVLVLYYNDEKFRIKYDVPYLYSIYRFEVDDVAGSLGVFHWGEDEQYLLDDAYLVVRVDTYDDFVEPKKRIKDND